MERLLYHLKQTQLVYDCSSVAIRTLKEFQSQYGERFQEFEVIRIRSFFQKYHYYFCDLWILLEKIYHSVDDIKSSQIYDINAKGSSLVDESRLVIFEISNSHHLNTGSLIANIQSVDLQLGSHPNLSPHTLTQELKQLSQNYVKIIKELMISI